MRFILQIMIFCVHSLYLIREEDITPASQCLREHREHTVSNTKMALVPKK